MIKNFKSPVSFASLEGDNLEISVSILNNRDVSYCEKNHRYTDEKYIITVNGNKIDIECSSEKGAFYALCDISKKVEDGNLTDGKIVCSPSFKARGYIEGFYGKPWTQEQRIDILTLMAKSKMNTVYYAPKDDEYHRDKWKELYPDTELARLKDLSDKAKEFYMDFYWCTAPGLSIKYTDENDFKALIDKTKQIYDIGVRNFGLLLDDISEDLEYDEDKAVYSETVNAHIDICNKYYSALMDIDSSIKLTVCPTLYHGNGDEYYISKLGNNISPFISLFWTGRDICSRELTSLQALKFAENTHHLPLYWDNYPVNDCAMYNEMHIAPIIGRDPDLYKYSEGIIANCMEYAECSKIPLLTYSDYLWNSECYDAQKSWRVAINQIIGKEDAENFIIFADHLYTSCLQDQNSRLMFEMLLTCSSALKKGDVGTIFATAGEYSEKMNACEEYLKKDLPICKELKKWSDKFFVLKEIIETLFNYCVSGEKEVLEELQSLIENYYKMPARISEDIDFKTELYRQFGISL